MMTYSDPSSDGCGTTLTTMTSMDLVTLARHHVDFLKELHRSGISITRPSKESLRRYCDLWLPLVRSVECDMKLIPPADVAWLWHCHRLAPHRYQSYLKAKFGMNCDILEPTPPFTSQFEQPEDIKKTRTLSTLLDPCPQDNGDIEHLTQQLWYQRYPQEPFFLKTTSSSTDSPSDPINSDLLLDGFDLLGSTDRQATFLWQVSGPRFNDLSFLQEGLQNYIKFLQLKRQGVAPESQIIVPTCTSTLNFVGPCFSHHSHEFLTAIQIKLIFCGILTCSPV